MLPSTALAPGHGESRTGVGLCTARAAGQCFSTPGCVESISFFIVKRKPELCLVPGSVFPQGCGMVKGVLLLLTRRPGCASGDKLPLVYLLAQGSQGACWILSIYLPVFKTVVWVLASSHGNFVSSFPLLSSPFLSTRL